MRWQWPRLERDKHPADDQAAAEHDERVDRLVEQLRRQRTEEVDP